MNDSKTYSNDGASSDGASSDGHSTLMPSVSPRPVSTRTVPWDQDTMTLPSIEDTEGGMTLVSRAVSLTLGIVGVLFLAGVLVASLVTVDLTVDAQGTLEPQTVWPVRAQESGTVASLHVASGDTVRAGDELVRLDSMNLVYKRAELQARHASQRFALVRDRTSGRLDAEQRRFDVDREAAALVRARANLRDQMAAHGLGDNVDSVLSSYTPGTHIGLDRAVSDVRTAQARFDAAQSESGRTDVERLSAAMKQAELRRIDADLRRVDQRLSRLRLTAPTDGVVLTDRLERLSGQYVTPGDLLLEVASLDGWRVHLFIPEQDVRHVRVGDSARVEVRAFRDARRNLLPGRVASVAEVPAADAATAGASAGRAGRYRVTVALDAAAVRAFGTDRLKPGYRVDGKVITRTGPALSLFWGYLTGKM